MNSKTKKLDDYTLEVIAEVICRASAGAGGATIQHSHNPRKLDKSDR